MGKYDDLKILKKTKARVNHICTKCGQQINASDFYYAEEIKDKFLHSYYNELKIVKKAKWKFKKYKQNGEEYFEFIKDMRGLFNNLNSPYNKKTFAKATEQSVNLPLKVPKNPTFRATNFMSPK